MKKISYLLIMIVVCMIMTPVGCKKKSDDSNTSSIDQFVGTWQGPITFSGTEVWDKMATLSIRLSDNVLTGFLTIQDDPDVSRLRQISFANGVMSFALVCSTPEDEDCQNFNVSGTLALNGNAIKINMSGTFCGNGGGEQGTVTGDIVKTSSTPDDSKYITFAQVGREWQYRITGFDGYQCILKFSLTEDLGNGVFAGTMSNDCGWGSGQNQFWWYVSPAMWCDMMNASLNTRILNIRSDAQVGDIYQTIYGEDTVTVTVLSLNDPVVIDGTTYSCYKILKKTTQFGSYSEGYAWGTFAIGFIKYEAILPNQPYDVHLEELIFKNF